MNINRAFWIGIFSITLYSFFVDAAELQAKDVRNKAIEDDGTVHVTRFDLPFSEFASNIARDSFVASRRLEEKIREMSEDDLSLRTNFDKYYYPPLIAKQENHYQVDIQPKKIAGVNTEIFTPKIGISNNNKNRILINLHGGGFRIGARSGGRVESIPVAAEGGYRVVSIDYRQGPENKFPAASEDVGLVYRELLKTYKPENIGIYGCSAGGILAGQAVSWFDKEQLPLPGAIGMFGAAMLFTARGMSEYTYLPFRGKVVSAVDGKKHVGPYMEHADFSSALVNPLNSQEVSASFPPTLLLNGTGDMSWSSSIYSHNRLVDYGVEAELHLWDGLGHCFLYDPDVPESQEAYRIIVRFFNKHLSS